MYNLNINLASTAASAVNNLLAVESACTTPRTPEILNSLIAMTNPLDNYNFGEDGSTKTTTSITKCPQFINNDSNSSSCSQSESSPMTPPSVQHTCSQLIKAGLKLSIESKRKCSLDNDDLLDLDANRKRVKKYDGDDDDLNSINDNGLTPEDEERRRRRRERNKIAATKCRLRKREKTVILVQESEVLETQNVKLKKEIQALENQRRGLVDMLEMHSTSCLMKSNQNVGCGGGSGGGAVDQHFTRNGRYTTDGPLPPVSSLPTAVIETNHTYNRHQNMEVYHRPNDYARSTVQYSKTPTILVEEPQDNTYTLSNLDNLNRSSAYSFNPQQCHNYTGGSNQNYNNSGLDNGCMA